MSLVPAVWSDDAESDIAKVGDTEFYRHEVEVGFFGLWNVLIRGERFGTVVWRTDFEAGGKALVILVAAGDHPVVDLASTVMPMIEDIARALDCDLVRFHTKRPGLVVKMMDMGYEPVEFIQRRKVA